MTKLICANSACKYLDDNNTCIREKVSMSWHSVVTMHDGRQEFLRCKNYEDSDFMKTAKKLFYREKTDEI